MAELEQGAEAVDAHIDELPEWKGEILSRLRRVIAQAVPDVVEDVKWRKPGNALAGVAVWSCDGLICTGENYKDKVKFTFAKGASLDDPAGLFNSSLGGNTRRAIDIYRRDEVDEEAFAALVRAAADFNAEPKAR